jgi:hypothetical protein
VIVMMMVMMMIIISITKREKGSLIVVGACQTIAFGSDFRLPLSGDMAYAP